MDARQEEMEEPSNSKPEPDDISLHHFIHVEDSNLEKVFQPIIGDPEAKKIKFL